MNFLFFFCLLVSDIDVKIMGDINSLLFLFYILVFDYFILWRGGVEISELKKWLYRVIYELLFLIVLD